MARPAMQAIVADVLPPELLGRAYALLYWAANVGIAVSAWIGGVLAGRTWLGLFAGDAITTVLFAALVVFRVPESRPTPASEARAVGWSTLAGDRPFLAFLATHFAFMIVFWQFQFALPLGGVRRRGLCGGRRARRAGSGTPEARGARRLTTTSSPRAGTQTFPRSARTGRAPPRCAGAGCTSPSGRCGSQTRS